MAVAAADSAAGACVHRAARMALGARHPPQSSTASARSRIKSTDRDPAGPRSRPRPRLMYPGRPSAAIPRPTVLPMRGGMSGQEFFKRPHSGRGHVAVTRNTTQGIQVGARATASAACRRLGAANRTIRRQLTVCRTAGSRRGPQLGRSKLYAAARGYRVAYILQARVGVKCPHIGGR